MKILLNLLLLVSVSVLGKAQSYEYKIDNRIRTFGTDFPKDSILWLMRNYYDIAFVPKNDVTFPYFNQFMKTIDELGYIDSVLATTKIPYEASSARIFIGKDIPYEIAKGMISVLKEEKEVEVVCQVNVPNFLYNTYEYYSQSRTVIVGSRDCPYKPENKYIRKKETIDALIRADSKEHFLQIAKENNEEENEYLDYLAEISRMPRFHGCEEVIDLEEKLLCSNRRLKDWINVNLASNFNYDDYVSILLSIDEDGNVIDMNFRDSGKSKKNAGEFKRIFLNMPKWIPATDQKSELPVDSIIKVYVRLKAND